MPRLALLAAIVLTACGVDQPPLPTCATLGCPDKPSGAAAQWEPCTDAVCWCRPADAPAAEACEI